MSRSLAIITSTAFGAALAASAAMAAPKQIGGSETWGAFEAGSGGARTCFVHAVPKDSRGDYKIRGDTYVQVAHHPGDSKRDVASVTAGYSYKEDSKVDLVIDGTTFKLFTHGDTAWGEDEKADRAIVKAMIKGVKMVVRGRSSRDTLTTDTYSLTGFTKAYQDASKACKVPTS